jgi:hypothetical protein
MRLKEYNIKSAIYNWASNWSEIKTKTLKNTGHKLISNEEPEFDPESIEELLHGAFGADPSDVYDCLNKDEESFRYQNLTEEEISQAKEEISSEKGEKKKHVHSSNFHKQNRTWTPSSVLWTLTHNTRNVTYY